MHVIRLRLVFAFVALINLSVEGRQLLMVHALWRHGDRSPVEIYPSDPWGPNSWPQGPGQITPEGMREELKLGQLLKGMYVGSLLEASYSQFQLRVRSTDVNRTLQSAYAVLSGMWSGVGNVSIPGESDWPQPWLPIPVHTIPLPQDYLLYTLTPCKAYETYRDTVVQTSPDYLRYETDNKDFLSWLSTKAGMTVTMNNIWLVADDSFIEILHNKTEPSWLNSTVYDRVWKLRRVSSDYLFKGTHQARLGGGPLLTEIIQRMQAFINCRNSADINHCGWLKRLGMFAYSAHDITVMAILSTLGRTDAVATGGLPSYAASITFELWAEDDGSFSVQTLYKDGFQAPVFVSIYPDGCPSNKPCPLDQFVYRSRPYHIDDIVGECQGILAPSSCDETTANALKVAEIVLGLIVAILGLCVLGVAVKLYQISRKEGS